ncbi:alpha/beta-hydrolase [Trametes gibbosa]|nr:alpha/beta-hydrolase [Trametes gibbosa]
MSSTPPVVSTVQTLRSRDGTTIHADAVGDPRNPHVLFIHGVTFSSAVFDDLVRDRRLTDHLYLVRYDLRCHGRSGMVLGEEAQRPSCQAEDFHAVVRAFSLHRPIVVAWYYLSSHTATAVADLYASAPPGTNPVSGLVLVAPLPFLDAHPDADAAEMPRIATARMRSVADALRASSQDAVMSARAKTELVHGVFAGPPRRVPDALRSSWLGQSIAQPAEVTACVIGRRHDPGRLFEAGRQGLPLMVLVGQQDALVDSNAVVGVLRRHFRNAEAHAVEGGCHALFLDQKDEFVKLLLVFVGRLAVRAVPCYKCCWDRRY